MHITRLNLFRATRIAAVVVVLAMTAPVEKAVAISTAAALRKIAKVADDVPLSKVDDVATEAASNRFARELVAKAGGRVDDVADRTRVLRKMLSEASEGLSPSIVRQLDSLEGSTQATVAVLAKGSKRISDAIPDVAMRSRLMAEGGPKTLLTIGRYDDLADDAVRFSVAAGAKSLPTPSGGTLVLDDFGEFFIKQGDRGKNFWDRYVKKNWKLWLGTTALATVLATPDEYLDEAGNLLDGAADKIARVGGRVLGTALKTGGTIVETTLWEVFSAFVQRPLGATIVAVCGLLALAAVYRPLGSILSMATKSLRWAWKSRSRR